MQITIPKIYFGKRKQRSQMCRLYTDDGRVVKPEIDVVRSCLVDVERGKGFLISTSNQYRHDGVAYQLLYEKSSLPIALREDLNIPDLKKLINQIFDGNFKEARTQQFKQALKGKLLDKITWIVAMPCSVILIGIVGQLLKGD